MRSLLILSALLAALAATGPAQGEKPGTTKFSTDVTDKKAAEDAAKIAAAVNKKMTYYESTNFTWCAAVTKERMKLMVDSAETAMGTFMKDAGIADWSKLTPNQRAMIVLPETKAELDLYTAWFADNYPVTSKEKFIESKKNSSWYTSVTSRPVLAAHVEPIDDEQLRMIIAHLVGHLVANKHHFHQNYIPGWLDEGTACYLEGKVTGHLGVRCFNAEHGSKRPKTKEKITFRGESVANFMLKAKNVMSGKSGRSLDEILKTTMYELSLEDAEKSYAMVAWMASQPGKLPEFLKVLKREWPSEVTDGYLPKKGEAQTKAIKEVFGLTVPEAEKAALSFVSKKP